MEAYARVENELRRMLLDAGVLEGETRAGAVRLARIAAERELVTPETVRAIEGISVMRNLVAHRTADLHGRVDVTPEQARDYLALADAVLYAIRNPPRDR